MPKQIKELRIGVKLKHARMMRGLRLKDVAQKAKCSESLLSKVENSHANPSLSMLHRIASVLEVNVGQLFASLDEEESIVQRNGERPIITTDSLRRGKGVALERLVPYQEGCLLQGNIHIIEPNGKSDGALVHRGEEVGYVLEGELELTVDGKADIIRAGDSFYFQSDIPHSYRNASEATARVLWVSTPPTF